MLKQDKGFSTANISLRQFAVYLHFIPHFIGKKEGCFDNLSLFSLTKYAVTAILLSIRDTAIFQRKGYCYDHVCFFPGMVLHHCVGGRRFGPAFPVDAEQFPGAKAAFHESSQRSRHCFSSGL